MRHLLDYRFLTSIPIAIATAVEEKHLHAEIAKWPSDLSAAFAASFPFLFGLFL